MRSKGFSESWPAECLGGFGFGFGRVSSCEVKTSRWALRAISRQAGPSLIRALFGPLLASADSDG